MKSRQQKSCIISLHILLRQFNCEEVLPEELRGHAEIRKEVWLVRLNTPLVSRDGGTSMQIYIRLRCLGSKRFQSDPMSFVKKEHGGFRGDREDPM